MGLFEVPRFRGVDVLLLVLLVVVLLLSVSARSHTYNLQCLATTRETRKKCITHWTLDVLHCNAPATVSAG
jgi:hypothetical protein